MDTEGRAKQAKSWLAQRGLEVVACPSHLEELYYIIERVKADSFKMRKIKTEYRRRRR